MSKANVISVQCDKLFAKASGLQAKATAIFAACEKEGRDPTETETSDFKKYMAEAQTVRVDANAIKQFEKDLEPDFAPLAASSASSRKGADIPIIDSGFDPGTGRMPGARGGLKFFFDRGGNHPSAEESALRFGMWIAGRLMPASGVNTSGTAWAAKRFAELDSQRPFFGAYQGEGSDTTGGIFVPPEFNWNMIVLRELFGVFRRNTEVINMSKETKNTPRWTGALSAYFIGEGGSITASQQTFDFVKLVAKKMGAIAIVSSELDEDSVIDMAEQTMRGIAYAFAQLEDQCGFNGDGTAGIGTYDFGGITGVLTRIRNPNMLASIPAASACTGLFSAAAGGSWAGPVIKDIQSMFGILPQFADTSDARFFCHRAFYYQVLHPLATAVAGTQFPQIINGVRTQSFLGYPVEFAQVMPKVYAAAKVPLLFGDLKQASKMGDRRQLAISKSLDATILDGTGRTYSCFQNDMMAIKGTQRMDIVVHDVGDDTTTVAQSKFTGPAVVGLYIS